MLEYRYRALPPGDLEIRLIRLLPGLPWNDIDIEIFHAQLCSCPRYEALSYTWGCDSLTQSIQVCKPGKRQARARKRLDSKKRTGRMRTFSLGVAENLFLALKHLRDMIKTRVLWIDAICINQQDKFERGIEVREMGTVYKNASNIIVWLGPSSDDSDLALETLQRIGEAVTYEKDEGVVYSGPGSWPYALWIGTEALESHEDCWFAVKKLLSREWFSRLWVFQEIVMARKATGVVGENCFDWEVSTRALWWLSMMKMRLDQTFQELDIQKIMDGSLRWFRESSCSRTHLNLFNALKATGTLLCSDPRDRLFAIRSLLRPENAAMIVPNYSASVEEVYTNFTKEWISRWNNVSFLRYCTFASAEPSESGNLPLPSWVPDWRHVGSTSDVLAATQCSGQSRAFTRFVDGNCLGVQGVLVGELSYVTRPTLVPATSNELRNLCRSWAQLVSTGDSEKEPLEFDDHFLEMIVSGILPEKQPSTYQNLANAEEVRAFLAGTDDRNDQNVHRALSWIRSAIYGRSFFVTSTGSFGLCPESAKVGDRVAVILGCGEPLILRPDEVSERTCFRVVGPCYMPGIMENEALLGPLPAGWSSRMETVEGEACRMFTNGDTRTQQDPRMPLPSGWRYIYGWEEREREEARELKDMKEQWFENVETEEQTEFDPRLTPELLREQGVAIEELILI